MRSIDLTIAAESQEVRVFKAVKRFDPSRLLGPTLNLLRSAQPIHIETESRAFHIGDPPNRLGLFSSLLHLLEELEALQIPYEMSITDTILRIDNDKPPVWVSRPGTKAEIVAEIEIARQRQAEQEAFAEFEKSYKPPEAPAWKKLFDDRWERIGFDNLLPEERDYLLLWELHVEVTNGSFDLYLSNSSGDHALDAVDVLRRIGPASILGVMLQVLEALPGGWCADRDERNRRLAATPNRWQIFRSLTDAYYDAIDAESKNDRLSQNIYNAYLRAGLLANTAH